MDVCCLPVKKGKLLLYTTGKCVSVVYSYIFIFWHPGFNPSVSHTNNAAAPSVGVQRAPEAHLSSSSSSGPALFGHWGHASGAGAGAGAGAALYGGTGAAPHSRAGAALYAGAGAAPHSGAGAALYAGTGAAPHLYSRGNKYYC